MVDLVAFYLNGSAAWVEFETLEISHPSFSQVYYIVRNATAGITATDEDSNVRAFVYYPLKITRAKASDDLDQSFSNSSGKSSPKSPSEIEND